MDATILTLPEFWTAIIRGLAITASLTPMSMASGLALGFVLAWMSVFGGPALRLFSQTYVFVFRGIPLLILLFLVYYGLPRLSILRGSLFWTLVLESPYRTALFVLTINNAAYLAEIVRGGLVAVQKGLLEAGAAIGMSRWQVMRRIHAPLGFRAILGSLGNETIAVVKASAITSAITVHDLMGGPSVIGKVHFDPFTPLVVVGAVYVVLVQVIDLSVRSIERRLAIPGAHRPD